MSDPLRLHLLLYDYVDGIVERREPHREEHLALIRRYEQAGRLVVAGAVGEPPTLGLLAMRAAGDAQSFVGEDPYVAAELVTRWRVEPWTVVAGGLLPDE